jgi:hypothetical protein
MDDDIGRMALPWSAPTDIMSGGLMTNFIEQMVLPVSAPAAYRSGTSRAGG